MTQGFYRIYIQLIHSYQKPIFSSELLPIINMSGLMTLRIFDIVILRSFIDIFPGDLNELELSINM